MHLHVLIIYFYRLKCEPNIKEINSPWVFGMYTPAPNVKRDTRKRETSSGTCSCTLDNSAFIVMNVERVSVMEIIIKIMCEHTKA